MLPRLHPGLSLLTGWRRESVLPRRHLFQALSGAALKWHLCGRLTVPALRGAEAGAGPGPGPAAGAPPLLPRHGGAGAALPGSPRPGLSPLGRGRADRVA